MRILIATPLYPPDIAPLAVYVKELAKRLRIAVEITIVAYAHIPEKIEDVRIVPVEKNVILPLRLIAFTRALFKEARKVDILFIQNGASVELPAILVGLILRKQCIVRLGDTVALASAEKRFLLKAVLRLTLRLSTHIIHEPEINAQIRYPKKTSALKTPPLRPEILPFTEYPREALQQYELSWEKYLKQLTDIFNAVAK